MTRIRWTCGSRRWDVRAAGGDVVPGVPVEGAVEAAGVGSDLEGSPGGKVGAARDPEPTTGPAATATSLVSLRPTFGVDATNGRED